MGGRGEIAVKGPTLMLGYLGVPLADTVDEEGFFRTGDGGYVDAENRLYWEGRLNDIIKTGGANVSPLEIDDVIRAHRSEEHTSELQSLMRISYAVFCLKKKKRRTLTK